MSKYPIGTKFYNLIAGDVAWWELVEMRKNEGSYIGETKQGRKLALARFSHGVFETNWRVELPKEDLFDKIYLRLKS